MCHQGDRDSMRARLDDSPNCLFRPPFYLFILSLCRLVSIKKTGIAAHTRSLFFAEKNSGEFVCLLGFSYAPKNGAK